MAGVRDVIGHLQEIWSGRERGVLALFALACARLIAISGPVADSVGDRLHARVRIVPNGTPPPDSRTDLREHSGPLTLLVASRWNAWKGHATLLDAWDRVQNDVRLTILGGPPPSGTAVDVPAMVERLRRPETVTVVGEVTDPSAYFDEADVILVPSDEPEPFGLVAIEAFARGRPVIASAGGGLRDIVRDGHDGWLFPARDAVKAGRPDRGLDRATVIAAGAAAYESYRAGVHQYRLRRSGGARRSGSPQSGTSP